MLFYKLAAWDVPEQKTVQDEVDTLKGLKASTSSTYKPISMNTESSQQITGSKNSDESIWEILGRLESANKYNAVGEVVKGDRAYGKYQIMGKNLKTYNINPDEFLNNPELQEQTARRLMEEGFGIISKKTGKKFNSPDNFTDEEKRLAKVLWYTGPERAALYIINPQNAFFNKKQHVDNGNEYPSINDYVNKP